MLSLLFYAVLELFLLAVTLKPIRLFDLKDDINISCDVSFEAVGMQVCILEETLPIPFTKLKSNDDRFASYQSSVQMRFQGNGSKQNKESCSPRE